LLHVEMTHGHVNNSLVDPAAPLVRLPRKPVSLVSERWREIWQVLKEGGVLACAGTLAGMLGLLLVLKFLTAITASNRSPAIWVWLAVPLVLMAAVAIASVLPARPALVVNPLIMMRDDN
jgi:hypothetical protein